MPEEYRIAKLFRNGNGSRRITLPKDWVIELFGENNLNSWIKVYAKDGAIHLEPVEIVLKEPYNSGNK